MRPKPQSLQQAQIEDFLEAKAQFPDNPDYCDLILNLSPHLRSLSCPSYSSQSSAPSSLANDLSYIDRQASICSYQKLFQSHLIKTLRQENGRLKIEEKEKEILHYEEVFAPVLRQMFEGHKPYQMTFTSESLKHLPLVGQGCYANAFEVTVDGQRYVAKFPFGTHIINDVLALKAAADLDPVVDVEAYSYADNVLITKFVEGQNLSQVSSESPLEFSDEDIISLVNVLVEMDKRGVSNDCNPGNFFYQQEKGFKIIDCDYQDNELAIPSIIMRLPITLCTCIEDKNSILNGNYSYKKRMSKFAIRLFNIIKENFPYIFQQLPKALKKNSFECASWHLNLRKYGHPPAHDEESQKILNQLATLNLAADWGEYI